MKKTIPTLCYENRKGSFLLYMMYGRTKEEVQKIADEINETKPEYLWIKEKAYCDSRMYYASERGDF